MGKNIFVSYKYADILVSSLKKRELAYVNGGFITRDRLTRVRDYVDELQSILDDEDHINLGEKDGESLKDFSEGYIQSSLKDKIYRSSITIVMISKGMVEAYSAEKDQWIPWEVCYSLKEITRNDRTSRMNAVLGIVLPDENNSYEWYYTENSACNCTSHHTDKLFNILNRNMFNMKNPTESSCNGLVIYHGDFSFIKTVKWSDFKIDPNLYLNKAIEIRDKKDLYNIKKSID
ncbi:TIR domain-containing protein [Flavobacterium lipolyticum]|uniref:TIR domain-containing protein n=1 Tax=Flavobacterium lipolyticum TaxID=2893754 RepID=A0ABS8M244_9FLAO|nr:TIR domain-containing protein [Flavobacterium sp. F-126]MCC9018897.1 TIR domain-containing protein [Flavobacterium sp. F-126]